MKKGNLCAILAVNLIATLLIAKPAYGTIKILLAEGNGGISVKNRLVGLGFSVTVSDASTWNSSFDYSPYDVVAFEYISDNPANISHLVNTVTAGDVGVVFFRGYCVENTALALGLVSSLPTWLEYQEPAEFSVVDNSHYITSQLDQTTYDLGYNYMTFVHNPGSNTTTLANGPYGATLVVHNALRAVITPYYAHPENHDDETAIGLDITKRTVEWAADVPEPCTVLLLGFGGLLIRKK